MEIMGSTPVYLIDCTGKEKGHVLVGLVPTVLIGVLYNLCEKEFDWMCGFEDSGFTPNGCTIFLDQSWGLLDTSYIAIKVRDFVDRLNDGWQRPCYLYQPR